MKGIQFVLLHGELPARVFLVLAAWSIWSLVGIYTASSFTTVSYAIPVLVTFLRMLLTTMSHSGSVDLSSLTVVWNATIVFPCLGLQNIVLIIHFLMSSQRYLLSTTSKKFCHLCYSLQCDVRFQLPCGFHRGSLSLLLCTHQDLL